MVYLPDILQLIAVDKNREVPHFSRFPNDVISS